MPKRDPPIKNGPRILNLSERDAVINTQQNATTFGGTVNSWALVDVYPNALMRVGRNSEKLFHRSQQSLVYIQQKIGNLT
jgi:hypothetical protein